MGTKRVSKAGTSPSNQTLEECLKAAEEGHWKGRPGESSMVTFASVCVNFLGPHRRVSALEVKDISHMLGAFRQRGLAAATICNYYNSFKRALVLSGWSTVGWPVAAKSKRKSREPIAIDALEDLLGWLRENGYAETADLGALMRGTGLRIGREALEPKALKLVKGKEYDALYVTGKGGHERTIPVVDPEARAVLGSPAKMKGIRDLNYRQHLRRWRIGVAALGIMSKLPTPHSVRHRYACEALRKSGNNLVMVQELLGHSDPATTAIYLQVDLTDKVAALMRG